MLNKSKSCYISAYTIAARMEKEKANFFRFIYLMVEVVPEILRFRLKQSYRNSNPQTLPSFLKEIDVLHALFHLFYPPYYCCWIGCRIQWERPKGFSKEQWNILYDADSTKCCKKNLKDPNIICICCVTPKNIDEKVLDLSLLCLILNNCSNLMSFEKEAVQAIREMKNNYVSHKSSCRLSNSDFVSLWQKAEFYINHLDSTKIYLHQRENLMKGPIDESLMQQYFVHCLETMSEIRIVHASIDKGNEGIKDIKETVDEMKSILINMHRQEPRNAVDKRKRQEPANCSDVSNEEDNINADDYMSKKRKQQKLEHLYKGNIDDLRYKLPDTKPLDKSKEYISGNLLGPKVLTSYSLQMDYKVCTMKDLSKQPGFKEEDKFICGKCGFLTITFDEFQTHKQQCRSRQKENIKVKNDYKNYVVARLIVRTKDKDLSSKIEKEWQQGNINPQHNSIEVNYITTGCVVIWVKVDIPLFLDIQKFYSALDNLVNDIFQKYAVNLPLYCVQVYDIATGYVDNLTDTFSCGDCKLTCNTLDNFISHKKTRCFQHVFSENDISLPMDIRFNQTVGFHEKVEPNSFVNLELRNLYAKSFVNEMQTEQPFTIRTTEGNMEVSDISTKRIESTQSFGKANEEENYVQLSLLLTRISPCAVRSYFDCKFAPACLDTSLNEEYNKLLDLKKERRINQSQWSLLFPRYPDIPSSETFDMRLMITLLRNLTPMTPPLYGFDRLPSAMETTPAADLARIRYYRNYLAHLDDGKIDITFFNTAWNDITSAIARLGGQQMKQECDYMKSKHLDQTKQEIMMDIKHSHSEKWEINESFASLKQSRTEMKISHELLQENRVVVTKEIEEMKNSQKDTVPWNIRVQHQQEISEWMQDQTTFLETRATHHILGSLPLNNCIVVTGSSGSGKSSNIHHAALHLRDCFEYEIIPVLTGPTDIMNYFNQNRKQVFVVDDICGKETINSQTLQMWRYYSGKMEKLFKTVENEKENIDNLKMTDPKLLISCRLHIYKELKFQQIKLLTRKECNLSDLCLLQTENMFMLQKYLPSYIIEQVIPVMKNVDFFPLLCKLSKNKTSEEAIKLFTVPLVCMREKINSIISENKAQFCALVLCILFDDGFNTNWLKLKSAPEKEKCKLEDIVKEFEMDINKEIVRNTLKSGFTTLEGTFIKRRGTEYRMIHDKISKFAAVICGQNLTEIFINYAPSTFIPDHFTFKYEENDDLIFLSEDKEEDYFKILFRDFKGFGISISRTFHDKQLIHQSFIDKLYSSLRIGHVAKCLLKGLGIVVCDVKQGYYPESCNTTPLIESAAAGHFDVVHFLIFPVQCDVNKVDGDDRSPLYTASRKGHSDVIQWLLENFTNIAQCNNTHGIYPLYVACREEHTVIVTQLLHKYADVSHDNIIGLPSLNMVCKPGCTDIAELQHNVVISHIAITKETLLYMTCKVSQYTDIVKLLLQHGADNSKRKNDGESPLSVACNRGYTDIVKLLIQHGADNSKRKNDGESPLYVACYRGYTDIVKLLLQQDADNSKRKNDGKSPLYVACYRRHTDIVKLLLQQDADNSKRKNDGKSLLYVACYRRHTDIVKLLQQDADNSKRKKDGESLWFVDRDRKYTDIVDMLLHHSADNSIRNREYIVKLLLDNNANDSKYINYCEPPYIFACYRGHTDIAKLLLEKNADNSKHKNYGESPLYDACNIGHTYIAKLLLEKNADNSKRKNESESLLHVVCNIEHTDLVKLLLEKNADNSQRKNDGESPLYDACNIGHTYIVNLLLEKNADNSKRKNESESLLHVVCNIEHTDLVKLLLEKNADNSQRKNDGESPLYDACNIGHTYIVNLLLEKNADNSKRKNDSESPLYVVCNIEHTDLVELLLEKNADNSKRKNDSESLLYVVCNIENTDIAKLLLQHNVDITRVGITKETLLHSACY